MRHDVGNLWGQCSGRRVVWAVRVVMMVSRGRSLEVQMNVETMACDSVTTSVSPRHPNPSRSTCHFLRSSVT